MRIGIYNRWLATLGGGERYTLALALALAEQGHAVELLSQQLVEPDEIERRLALRAGHLPQRRLADDPGCSAASAASADYDLFICGSHGELFPSWARRSWMVVYFPEPDFEGGLSPWPRPYVWRGCHAEERDGRGLPFRWLAPSGAIWIPSGPGRVLHLTLERPVAGSIRLWLEPAPRWAAPDEAAPLERGEVAPGGTRPRALSLRPGRSAHIALRIPRGGAEAGYLLRWQAEPLALDDPRPLGARLLDLSTDPPRRWLGPLRRRGRLPLDAPDQEWAIWSYHKLLAISPYTAHWVQRRWGPPSEVLPPAVPLLEPGLKRPIILSVGRFFQGLHAKRQDVLIATFRRLHPSAAGWELHLAGGLDTSNAEHQRYLTELRAAAEGLPIVFHVNEPSALINDLYARATLYWHAAGYGADPERAPEAQEHFGIAPVEAMSAGAIPLVFAGGGPADVVRDGVDGLHWAELDELAQRSAALIADAARCRAMAESARARAAEYGDAAFARRVADLLEGL